MLSCICLGKINVGNLTLAIQYSEAVFTRRLKILPKDDLLIICLVTCFASLRKLITDVLLTSYLLVLSVLKFDCFASSMMDTGVTRR